MRVVIIALGKMKDGPERELVDRYIKRAKPLGRSLGIKDFEIIEIAESSAKSSTTRKLEEAKKILGSIPDDAELIALDESGTYQTSKKFASTMASNIENGTKCLTFVIGGPDGLDQSIRQRAKSILSFSPLTWPHQIVRALLSEQLYRATTILTGHPYHRS
ncbi:23S rRNA (pseudouridine(1915)-N(3))-methyltransferase [hydrothermal vent metagenome]|uniref:23S rRNA (Pseudouridine(1915)-N(3))-methyltransferase n=1 Tax=hydrothermal vent metagenome TaxID=652676 RepID=A0A3B0TBG5_9ZZZZ